MESNYDLTELNKLETYLKEHGYVYYRADKPAKDLRAMGYDELHQIIVFEDDTFKNRLWDVIIHKGTYGCDEGLLEIMVGDDVWGYLTADEVIERWLECDK